MTLLISTSRGIVSYNELTHHLQHVLADVRETYGISWTPDGEKLIVACTSGKGHALSFDDLGGYARSEVGTVVCNGVHSPECLSAPHQITCIDNTYAVVANSGRNALTKIRLDDWCMSHHRVDDVFWDRFDPTGKPGLHLNSVYYHQGIVYAVAHNFRKGSRVFALSWPDFAVRESWHFSVGGMHNVALLDGRLLVCDSLHGCVVDALTGETFWSNGGTGMTRGLAASGDRIYVGSSGFASRDSRANTSGGIWVLDRSTFETIEFVTLADLGGVNEIRITDTPDACHHGHVLSGIPTGRQLPQPDLSPPELHLDLSTQAFHLQGWRVVSGTPANGGARLTEQFEAADDSGLLVVHASGHCVGELSGIVSFSAGATDAHASLVLEYEGPGDTAMVAGMLRQTDVGLIASIWTHSGTWNCLVSQILLEGPAPPQSPIRLAFSRRNDRYVLSVDDAPCLHADAEITSRPHVGSVGVRLSGPGVVVFELNSPTTRPPLLNPH